MHRRKFIGSAAAASLLAAIPLHASDARSLSPDEKSAIQKKQTIKILIRSGWQTINIGDIAHTPGTLRTLYDHFPDAEITLWPGNVKGEAEELLKKNFPSLKYVSGTLTTDGKPVEPALLKAFEDTDLFLYNSGMIMNYGRRSFSWDDTVPVLLPLYLCRNLGKPFGIYGQSFELFAPPSEIVIQDILNDAAFVYTRETESLDYLKSLNIKPKVMDFVPDAAFGFNIHDDEKANSFLKAHSLENKKFICVVPRLRWTPYQRDLAQASISEVMRKRFEENEKFRPVDMQKLRDLITAFVRKTNNKVLACPEMTYQVELLKTELYDPLPEDVKKNVVYRDSFWQPDEAFSTYAEALAVISIEMHSPIMALVAGTPALYLRQPTDGRKGQMIKDIGLPEWYFDIDSTSGEQIINAVLKIHNDNSLASAKVKTAMKLVKERQATAMKVISQSANTTINR
jgi:polysaccharide pyruvyl transferase WcaK-like protein